MTTLTTVDTTLNQLGTIVDYQMNQCKDLYISLGDISYKDINTLNFGNTEKYVTDWSMSQICQMNNIPYTYLKNCHKLNPQLAEYNFKQWTNAFANKEVMVRLYKDEVVGILSNKYTTFDNDRVMNLIDSTDIANYTIVGHTISPERMTVRLRESEPFMQDLFCGVQIENSQVGKLPMTIKFLVYKQVCTNGLMVNKFHSNVLYKRHIGNFLVDIDNVKESLKGIKEYRNTVKSAITDSMNTDLLSFETKRITDTLIHRHYITEQEVKEGYIDLMFEKYGRTRWGIINILTELSQKFTLDKRIEIETFAGNLVA